MWNAPIPFVHIYVGTFLDIWLVHINLLPDWKVVQIVQLINLILQYMYEEHFIQEHTHKCTRTTNVNILAGLVSHMIKV